MIASSFVPLGQLHNIRVQFGDFGFSSCNLRFAKLAKCCVRPCGAASFVQCSIQFVQCSIRFWSLLIGWRPAGQPSQYLRHWLMRGMATLLQGNQELLVVREKVGRLPGELGVSKSMECDIFPLVLWHCWLGDRKGIRPVKKLGVGLLVMMIRLELCMTYSSNSSVVTTTSTVLCFNKHWLTQVHLENGC